MNPVVRYFSGEKAESHLFVFLGIVTILVASYFLLGLKSSFWKGTSIPFVLVAVLELAVGFTITDMITRAGPEFVKGMEDFYAARTPIPRAGYIEDIEGMAAYLCSDASRYHTGDTIPVDGGSAITPVYSR